MFMRMTTPFKAAATMLVLLVALAGCSTTRTLELEPTPLSSSRYSAIVIDANSGKVLYEAESGAPRYPASLTKMMTLYMLFEAMDSGRVSRDTQIPVSDYAAKRPPTKIGFKAGETIDVDSAIRAMVVKSANDVAVAVGEYLGGSEEQFAQMMTAKARALGMNRTVFRNASGLSDEGQVTTARDMAVLGLALKKRFPSRYGYFSSQSFSYNGRTITGHNELLTSVAGVDGIKTGYIRASGFNICTSVRRDGRRLVIVVMGGDTARERNAHVADLIERFLPKAARGGI